jgi:hypothetical protein
MLNNSLGDTGSGWRKQEPAWMHSTARREARAKMAEQSEPGPAPFTQPNDRPHLPRYTQEQLRVLIPEQEGKLRDLEHTSNQSASTIAYQRDLVDGLKAQRDGGPFSRPSPTAQRDSANAHRHTEDRFISHTVRPDVNPRYPYTVAQYAELCGVSVRTIDRGESSSGLLPEPPEAGRRPASRGNQQVRMYGDPEVQIARRVLGKDPA